MKRVPAGKVIAASTSRGLADAAAQARPRRRRPGRHRDAASALAALAGSRRSGRGEERGATWCEPGLRRAWREPWRSERHGLDDDDAIWAILRPAIEAGTTFTAEPQGGRDGAFAYWRPPGAVNFVAEDEGRILGTSYLRPNQKGGGAHVANAGYCTAPEAQGRGVARALLDHSLAEARARGFRAMQFNFVVATNTRAIDIWTRAGFATVGRLPGAFRHPQSGYVDALVMYKTLT